MRYFQVNERCTGCLACLHNCPANALDVEDNGRQRKLRHNMARCARCGTCWRVCPEKAIEFQYMLRNQWDDVITLDLVSCRVCGETLYTAAFGNALAGKLGTGESALCDKHKDALFLKVQTHFTAQKPEKPSPR